MVEEVCFDQCKLLLKHGGVEALMNKAELSPFVSLAISRCVSHVFAKVFNTS
jgi:hypothetical protein